MANEDNTNSGGTSTTGASSSGKVSITKAVGWTAAGEKVPYDLIGGGSDNGAIFQSNNMGVPGYLPNQNKIVHLHFKRLTGTENLLNTSLRDMIDSIGDKWDNWRDGLSSLFAAGNDTPNIVVPQNIYPVMESMSINGGFTIGAQNAADAMKKGSGSILSGIKDAAGSVAKFSEAASWAVGGLKGAKARAGASMEALKTEGTSLSASNLLGNASSVLGNAVGSSGLSSDFAGATLNKGAITSRFDDFPVFDADSTTLKSPGQIVLQFNIGSGNYFDGEIEVVRPIAAIENKIAPIAYGNRFFAPMGSPAQFSAAVWGASIGVFGDLLGSLAGELQGFVNTATSGGVGAAFQNTMNDLKNIGYNVQESVLNAQDAASAALGPYTTFLFMRMGNSTLGPYYVSSASHTFDYSNVDEKGYPASGTLTLEIKSILKPTNVDMLTQMGYVIDK